MLSMKDIAAVKAAIGICNNPELKKEILCAPGSGYDLNKRNDRESNTLLWYETVEKKAAVVLGHLGLSKQLQEKVTSIVFSVGMRMLLWAEYHESILGLSREYSVLFLENSFLTPQGMMDSKKAAEELIKDESLNTKQKYTLACLYYFTDHIPVLFRKMTIEDKTHFYDAEKPRRIKQPEIVKFWSYYLMGDVDKLMGGRDLDRYRLEKAVRSGSQTAVEYCLEKTKLRTKMDAVLDAAVEAVRCRISVKPSTNRDGASRKIYEDEELWVPSDYYVAILCFLFSKMGEDEQVELFKKEIEVIESESEYQWRIYWNLTEGGRKRRHSEKGFVVLEYFLNWPYQDYFVKKAKLMWEFLPEKYYAVLLLMICNKIESKYGEGKSFNYRELLKEFWCQSPDRYKRHVFKNQEGLLIKLLTFKNFTYEDEEIIKLILASATTEEKENILSTEKWTTMCVKLMAEEKWDTLDRCTLYFFSPKEEASKFKRKLSFREKAKVVCIDFAMNDNFNAVESFIKWSSLPGEEVKKLKEEMINSWYGLKSCVQNVFHEKVKRVDKFIRWCLSSEEVKAFKKELIFSNCGSATCAASVNDEQELVTELIKFCLSSEEEVRELKKRVAYGYGGKICKDFISYNIYSGGRIRFDGGRWEEVEKFLTWCFSSEEEISDFKKNKLFKDYGEEIHLELIKCSQWEEAETFFAWLGLSVEEIKELKKRTVLDKSKMFIWVNDEFPNFGNNPETVELNLRWFLTDKEMVLECKDKLLKNLYEDSDANEIDLKNFELIVEQHLRDLEDENMGVKRTAENFLPNKKLCTVKPNTIEAEYDEPDKNID